MRTLTTLFVVLAIAALFVSAANAFTPSLVDSRYFDFGGYVLYYKTWENGERNATLNELANVDEEGRVSIEVNATWLELRLSNWFGFQEGAAGVRAYTPGCPELVVKYTYVKGPKFVFNGTVQSARMPLIILSNPQSTYVFVARLDFLPDPDDPSVGNWYLVLAVWDWALNAYRYYNSYSIANATSLAGYTFHIYPAFEYDQQTGSLTFVWKVDVADPSGVSVVYAQANYDTAYLNATDPSIYEVKRFVEQMSGWYVWVGSGVQVYIGTRYVPNTRYFDPYYETIYDPVNSDPTSIRRFYIEYIINWVPKTEKILTDLVQGTLPTYEGAGVFTNNAQNPELWDRFYRAIFPFALALVFGGGAKRFGADEAVAAVIGGAGMVFGGVLWGWSIFALITTGVATAVTVMAAFTK